MHRPQRKYLAKIVAISRETNAWEALYPFVFDRAMESSTIAACAPASARTTQAGIDMLLAISRGLREHIGLARQVPALVSPEVQYHFPEAAAKLFVTFSKVIEGNLFILGLAAQTWPLSTELTQWKMEIESAESATLTQSFISTLKIFCDRILSALPRQELARQLAPLIHRDEDIPAVFSGFAVKHWPLLNAYAITSAMLEARPGMEKEDRISWQAYLD